jgi:hypothetical protein
MIFSIAMAPAVCSSLQIVTVAWLVFAGIRIFPATGCPSDGLSKNPATLALFTCVTVAIENQSSQSIAL